MENREETSKRVKEFIKKNKDVAFFTEDKKGRQAVHITSNAWFASQLHLYHFGITTNANVSVSVIFDKDKTNVCICNEPNCLLFQKKIRHQYN
jgi:uncharacterized pyridoxamine 5'-phosphate oxidase family protein